MLKMEPVSVRANSEIDDAILSSAIREDRDALAILYDTYANRIYRYCYSRVSNAADAEDLTTQVFLGVLEALPRYRHRGYFSSWVFRIARNKTMDFFRIQRRQDYSGLTLADPPKDDLLEDVIRDQTARNLRGLIQSLTEDEQELIRLRYVVDLTYIEIAMLLGRKEDAVRKSLSRILTRLHSQMEVQNA
jgi:RNA polymerase sigma-70 factor, ECF subfamily